VRRAAPHRTSGPCPDGLPPEVACPEAAYPRPRAPRPHTSRVPAPGRLAPRRGTACQRRPRPSRPLPAQPDAADYKGAAAQCSARRAVGHPPLRRLFLPLHLSRPPAPLRASHVELPLARLPVTKPLKTYAPSPRGTPRAAQSLVPTTSSPAHRGTMASAGHRRRATPPAPPPLRTPTGIKPRDSSGPPPPAPDRSRPPVRRNLAEPPSAGARGPNFKEATLSEGLSANQGLFGKTPILSRAPAAKCNSNSKAIWLFLVNCVESRRKIRKMQNQFCWIRGEKSHNFCYSRLS
jgi:hypothetical protein